MSLAQEKTFSIKFCPSLEKESAPVISIVKEYWRLAKIGSTSEAKKLKTDKWKGFEIKAADAGESFEQVIAQSKLHLVCIEQIEYKDNSKGNEEVEVAVKVKNRAGLEYYLFHTIVKVGADWKIFSNSF